MALIVALPAAAAAQPSFGAKGPHRGTLEFGGGVIWTGGYDAGSVTATLTRNPATGTSPLTLFVVSGRLRPAAGAGVHLGVFLARRVSAEAALQYSRPILRARVTHDLESAPDTAADSIITSYLLGGSLLYYLGEGRFVPFVSGGGAYLRQIHEGGADVLTGTEIHAGGGVKYWLGTGAHRFGLRVDGQASARSKSVAFEQKRRLVPTVGAGIVYQF
jgi:hypothetical protein